MRNIRWQVVIAVGGIVLVLGLLIGQTPDTQESSPQPVSGGVYAEALVGQILRLNPILDRINPVDRDIDRLIYSGLVRYDSRGIPAPDLAQWAVSADATLYNFSIREDARWHDGTPVSSDDVIYTFSKFQDPDFPGSPDLKEMWSEINIVRLDDTNLQFQLPEPFAPFLDYLTVGLLPEHLLRGVSISELIDHPFNLEPVGTGPFVFDRYILNEEEDIIGVSLVSNDDFYRGAPYLERFEFKLYPSDSDAYRAYQNGDVQGLGSVGLEILNEVLQVEGLNLHSTRLPQVGMVLMNLDHQEKTFFAEKNVRNALSLSINRQGYINSYFSGQGIVPAGPILPGSWAFAEGLTPIPYDPERAARILEDDEWILPVGAVPGTPEYVRSKEDQRLEFELLYPDDETHQGIAESLRENWAAIGVLATPIPVDPEELLPDRIETREFEAVLTELDLSFSPDPDPYPFWHDSQVDSGQNYAGFSDRNSSIWLEQARISPDLLRRTDLYRDFQYRFKDQTPALLLYHPVFSYALDSQVQGVRIGFIYHPSDRFAEVDEWYLLVRRTFPANEG
jgi:peptide/nickel transport system substrate-binding protein